MSEPDQALVRRADVDAMLDNLMGNYYGMPEDTTEREFALAKARECLLALPAAACEKDKRIAALEGALREIREACDRGNAPRIGRIIDTALAREAPPAEAPAPTCATCKGGGRVRYASQDPIFGRTPGPEFPCPDCATGGDDAE